MNPHFSAQTVKAAPLLFSDDDERKTAYDKYRGLRQFGPYGSPVTSTPKLAFVFPEEFRDAANKLYLALRNGVGKFPGLARLLRMTLEKDQVSAVSGFSLGGGSGDDEVAAELYARAIDEWLGRQHGTPDLFIVIHPKTPRWDEETPYYTSKAALLRRGLVSQHVTLDLLQNPRQFEWSAAEIALQMFVKLGGIPWVVAREPKPAEAVIGVGRAIIRGDDEAQQHIAAFTACLDGRGPLRFVELGAVCDFGSDEYFRSLASVVRKTLDEAEEEGARITLHLTKELSRRERGVIMRALQAGGDDEPIISVARIADEEDFLVLDDADPNGIPLQGTAIGLGGGSYCLYTEGRLDERAWSNRSPSAVRVTIYEGFARRLHDSLLTQVLDLSQVNYRGFRASATPVTLKYSKMIAELLGHLPRQTFGEEWRRQYDTILRQRMWFV